MKDAKILSGALVVAGSLALWACSSSETTSPSTSATNGTNATNATNATNTGTSSTGTPSAATNTSATGSTTTSGATTTSAGNTTTAGTTGGGPVECSNSDLATLPIDATGWVARDCNSSGIQGAWYCYADGVGTSDCMENVTPYRAGGGMCLTGSTVVNAEGEYGAWGAGIGLSLNETGEGSDGSASVKSAYNATMNGVAGFAISITGTTGDKQIRVGFTGTAGTTELPAPFYEVPGPGDYVVMLADALVPAAWDVENAGMLADPTNLYDMQIQIVGGEDPAAAYDFCIASVTPVGEDGNVIVGETVQPYGSQVCGNLETITLGNEYAVQNNVWNTQGSGTQCVSALWNNGKTAGFVASPQGIDIDAAIGPKSYPSVVLGWHYGTFHGSYTAAKQISSLTTIPSKWTYTVPTGTESYNVSYDIWIHSESNPAQPNGGLELMIWANHRDTVPIGQMVEENFSLGGGSWEVWYGQNTNGWNVVSYVNISNPSGIELDAAEFINNAVTRGYAANSDYLLGVQAGFEIWRGSTEFRSDSYTVTIN
ncbi:MAG TPA: hypothetical protein VFU02_09890 [Polyangiaceae bacterium]|nr:hypothetical protein [Polyangiaceae bacterium]